MLTTVFYSSFFNGNLFYIVMGVILILVAAWLLYTKFYRYTLLKNACTVPVDARLFRVDSKFGGKGGRRWNITYEFFYRERRYIVSNDYWEQMRYNRPIEGNIQTIMINPDNPNDYYDALLAHARRKGIVCGIMLIGTGIFIMLMPLFIR